MSESWRGRSVAELERASGTRVAFVVRLGAATVPTGATVVQDGDIVHVVLSTENADDAVTTLEKGPED